MISCVHVSGRQYFLASEQAQVAEYKALIPTMLDLRDRLSVDPKKQGPQVLNRFLRAKKFKVDVASAAFEAHIQWRQKNDVEAEFPYPELNALQDIYPHGFHKTDKQGRPIYIEVFRDVRLKSLFEVTTEERYRRYKMSQYEYLLNVIFPGSSIEADKYISQQVTILDLKNGKAGAFEASKLVSMISSFSTDNYPDILNKLYVVNSPLIAQGVWKIIKLLLNDTINKKIQFLGKDYTKRLLEDIDEENLPEFLGGKSQTNSGKQLRHNIGPWNKYEDIHRRKIQYESESPTKN